MPESYPVVPQRRELGILGWIALIVATAAAVLWLPTLAGAQEMLSPTLPGNPAPADAPGPWWVALIGSDAFWNAFAVALTFLVGLLSKIVWVQKAKEKIDADVLATFEAAAIKTYNTSVRAIREKAADGKITAAEAAQLRTETIGTAKELASDLKGPAAKAVATMARPVAEALVEKVVAKLKRQNASPE